MTSDELDRIIRGKNINFLIGSGASVGLYKTLSFGWEYPTFEELVCHKELTDNARIILYMYYFLEIIEPMNELNINELDNEEEKSVCENYYKLVQTLCEYLQAESNERPKRINIFTTNYDLLFEKTFDSFVRDNPLIYFNDGSRGVFTRYINNKNFYLNITHSGYNDTYRKEVPTINLFKMHGSISWNIEKNNIIVKEDNDLIKTVKTGIEECLINKEEVDDIVNIVNKSKNQNIEDFIKNLNHNVNDFINNNDIFGDFSSEATDRFYNEYLKLPIINPDKYKFFETISEQHYYQLIRSFSYELEKKQAVLIVFGFSFADEHIKDIFERSLLNPELQVIIICYSKKGQDKLKQTFGGYKNIIFLPEEKQNINGNFSYLLRLLGGDNGK